jgi:trimeric autotransporter adhesin
MNPKQFPQLLLKSGAKLIAVTFLMALLFTTTTSPTAAAPEPANGGLPLEMFLTAEGNLNLPPEGVLGSIDPAGFTLISGPNEPPRFAPSPTAMTFATDDNNWDPRFFSAGLNNTVRAVAWDGANLYVGGSFTSTDFCLGCNHIARWDGATWHALGNGVNNWVYALAWTGTDLYVGGAFSRLCSNADCSTTAAANGVNSIARWDGGIWHALGNGVNSNVEALAWTGTDLYVGGRLWRLCSNADCSTTAAANGVNHIARWDGGTWHALGNGVNNVVYALAWTGADLYVGGGFTRLCSNAACSTTAAANGVNRIARWDGGTWHALGNGVNSSVDALAWTGTDLYVGGQFTRLCSNADCSTTAAANGVNRIARWDGGIWHALGNGVNSAVVALTWTGADLYVGGFFTRLCSNADCSTTAAANGVNRVARWNGGIWHPLDNGVNGPVRTLAWTGTDLYVGGDFTRLCADVSCADWLSQDIPPHKLAHWTSGVWASVGEGAQGQGLASASGGSPIVNALAWTGQDLFVGGNFTHAGLCEEGCNRIARWDGSVWHALGNGVNGTVLALAWTGADLYVGGVFTSLCSNGNCSTTAAANGVNRIARWDGSAWHALGNGVNSTAWALAWTGTDLYVGGGFTRLCSNADCSATAAANGVNRVARWDGGIWHALGNGVNSSARALAWTGTQLYVGGDFTRLCSNADCSTTAAANGVNRVARWDGGTWHSLGNGVNSTVNALAWTGTDLYVGGQFARLCSNADCSTTAAANGVNRVARWGGGTWHALGNGVNNWVEALAWTGTDLYVGGQFPSLCSNADCTSTAPGFNRLARWDGTAWHNLSSGVNSGAVYALAWDDDSLYHSLYAGGLFVTVGGKPSVGIGRWRLAAIWDGEGGDNNGTTAANWSGDTVPSSSDVAIFDSASSKHAVLDVGFPSTLHGLVIEDSYGGVVTQTINLALTADLQAHGGVLTIADPAVHSFTVGGAVYHIGGTLRQTRPVNDASVPFLLIDDGAANVKYRGVHLDTTGDATDLGDVTVSVRAINRAVGEYCTTDGDSSPLYAERCYQITPTIDGPALLRLWALTSELNGINTTDLAVYRNFPAGGVSWVKLAGGSPGVLGNYSYAEANTPGFSHFLLAHQDNGPTAVSLQQIQAQSGMRTGVTAVFLLATLCLVFTAMVVMRPTRQT